MFGVIVKSHEIVFTINNNTHATASSSFPFHSHGVSLGSTCRLSFTHYTCSSLSLLTCRHPFSCVKADYTINIMFVGGGCLLQVKNLLSASSNSQAPDLPFWMHAGTSQLCYNPLSYVCASTHIRYLCHQ